MPLTLRMHGGVAPQESAGEPEAAPDALPLDEATLLRGDRRPNVPRARRCTTCNQTFSGDSRFCPFDGEPLVDAPDWNPAADPLVGKTVDGRYEVLSVVGEGGMGTVYEARHTSLGRLFAMKVLRRDIAKDAELVARFIQEAKAAAAIGHPNIVAVSDFGEIPGEQGEQALPYFVMEFLTGTSLAALLRAEKTLPAERIGRIMLQCAAALSAAHAAGVIHRDLKPDNIYLVRSGEKEFVKLLDFGVAKIAGGKRLTRIGMVFGTPHYMSPEQAEGKRIDPRADVYALGIIMYECFVGRVPFEADTYMGVLTKHMYVVPEPIEHAVPDASRLGAFGPIVMRCLAKHPEDRYASMTEVASAVELALEDPERAAALSIHDERPRRDALRLRERDPVRGRVPVPAGVREPLSTGARVAIAVAAVAVPVLLALGFRAWRASQAGVSAPAPEVSAASPIETASPPAVAAPVVRAPEASAPPPEERVAAPAETAKGPSAGALTAGATSKPTAAPARTGGGASKPPKGGGEIVDPWR